MNNLWVHTTSDATNFLSVAASMDGTKLAACNKDSIYISENSGFTWTKVINNITNYVAINMCVDGSRIIAVTSTGDVVLSEDGYSWEELSNQTGLTLTNCSLSID